MSEESVKLTREQLYKEVWKTPIHRLSEKYGLSDVGLAKACKRMDIPRPPRGYWRRKETGAKVKKVALPKAKQATQLEAVFHPGLRRSRKPNGEGEKKTPELIVEVEDQLVDPHPLVEVSLKRFSNTRTDVFGHLDCKAKKRLDLNVSADLLDRSLRIMDAIFKAWEALGHQVELDVGEQSPRTLLRAGEESLAISIEERVKEVDPGPSEEEKLQPKWKWKDRTEYQLTGQLVFKVRGDLVSDVTRFYRRYQDGSKFSLESRVGRVIVAGLEYLERREGYVEYQEQRRLERLGREKQWAIERQHREEERQRREDEEARVEEFLASAKQWDRAERVRAYIDAARSAMLEAGKEIEEVENWVRWANGVADGLDPLSEMIDGSPSDSPTQPENT